MEDEVGYAEHERQGLELHTMNGVFQLLEVPDTIGVYLSGAKNTEPGNSFPL
jgi:hypothetical protein